MTYLNLFFYSFLLETLLLDLLITEKNDNVKNRSDTILSQILQHLLLHKIRIVSAATLPKYRIVKQT